MNKQSAESGESNDGYDLSQDPRLTLNARPLPASPHDAEDDEGFQLEFLEAVLASDPCHEEAIMYLGHAYTRRGDYEKGLCLDQRLTRLRPADPTAFYNLACSYALLDYVDEGLAALGKAVSLGYRDLAHILKDSDLVRLRKDPRFPDLVRRLVSGEPSDS